VVIIAMATAVPEVRRALLALRTEAGGGRLETTAPPLAAIAPDASRLPPPASKL